MRSFFSELKRRNVVKVGVAYLVVGWILIEAASVLMPTFGAPGWVFPIFALVVVLGFPLAAIFAWAFEITPQGLMRTHDVPVQHSITSQTSRRLDFIIIGLLAIALTVSLTLHFSGEEVGDDVAGSSISRDAIAVLPFANRSADTENAAFFADGIHDDLLTQLAKIGSLKVISRTSVLEYRDTQKNMKQIGNELGANKILEGGVQRAGDRVRINVQLIDTNTDEHLWADTYDRELSAANIFAIQSEIALAIASAMQATLSPEEHRVLDASPTDNLDAYDLYLRGRALRRNAGRDDLDRQLQFFRHAVVLDPEFALAHVALASALIDLYWFYSKDSGHLAEAKIKLDRSMELRPGMAEAHVVLGDYFYHGFLDYDRALAELDIALNKMPGHAEAHAIRAFVQRRRGDIDESIPSLSRAIELDPRNELYVWEQGGSYHWLQDYDSALKWYDRALEIDPTRADIGASRALVFLARDGDTAPLREALSGSGLPDDPYWAELRWKTALLDRDYASALAACDQVNTDVLIYQVGYLPISLLRGLAYKYQGNEKLALEQLNLARELLESRVEHLSDDERVHSALGQTYAALGKKDDAVRHSRRAVELLPASRDAGDGPVYLRDLVLVLAMVGEDDAAIEALDRYLSGYVELTLKVFMLDPRFERLNNHPGIAVLKSKYSESSGI